MSVKSYRYLSLIAGIFLVAFSFMMLQERGEGILTLAVFIGIAFIFHGVGEISMYFGTSNTNKHGWLLVGGIISLIFGMWTLSVPGTIGMALALPLVIATWIIFFGVLRIVAGFHLKKEVGAGANMNLLIGLISVILGFVLLRRPDITDFVVTIILFIIFLVQGIGSIGNFFLYKQK